MKQLDKEQLPKVIALGVMAAVLLGYAAYSWLGRGGGAAAPAVASTMHPAPLKPAAAAASNPASSVMALAPIDNEDPFRPALQPTPAKATAAKPTAAKPPAPKPAPKAAPTPVERLANAQKLASRAGVSDMIDGPDLPMDALPAVAAPSAAAGGRPAASPKRAANPTPRPARPAARPQPPAPKPPAVMVTGILEGQENVAILKWSDTQRQVVRPGDRLDGGYVVKAIRSDAVVLSRGASQWVVRLGEGARG